MNATALAKSGHAWDLAKQKERELMTELYAAIVAASADGMPETQIAKVAGVDRMTVRRALGKL